MMFTESLKKDGIVITDLPLTLEAVLDETGFGTVFVLLVPSGNKCDVIFKIDPKRS